MMRFSFRHALCAVADSFVANAAVVPLGRWSAKWGSDDIGHWLVNDQTWADGLGVFGLGRSERWILKHHPANWRVNSFIEIQFWIRGNKE